MFASPIHGELTVNIGFKIKCERYKPRGSGCKHLPHFFSNTQKWTCQRKRGESMAGKYKYLTFEDRKKIEAWHARGERPLDIAEKLGVHTATIYHELQRGYTGEWDEAQRSGSRFERRSEISE